MIGAKIDKRQLDKRLATIIAENPKRTRKALGRTASQGINMLLDRNHAGRGYNGKFSPYSEEYALFRIKKGAQASYVDLNFTGDMGADLTISRLTQDKAIISATTALSKKKIASTTKQRPWFGFNNTEKEKLRKIFKKQFKL